MITIEGTPFLLWMLANQALLPMAVKNWEPCQKYAQKDWLAFCGILQSEGFAIDCENANKEETRKIKWKLAWQHGTKQHNCIFNAPAD